MCLKQPCLYIFVTYYAGPNSVAVFNNIALYTLDKFITVVQQLNLNHF